MWGRARLTLDPSLENQYTTTLLCTLTTSQSRAPETAKVAMAPGQKLYPRATVKKIVKAQSKCNVSKNVDVMIFLDYVLFMQTLVKEAAIDSKQAGERGISAKSVKKVTADTLAKFKG
ncbi:hypothetical protein BJ166DRAFT_265198 [Pestalotiopsis sp. NC0098]|nr:hypothetical protein BJ166DRAFT_265198 [Pestalotiopsis sp. NC0098]